MMVEISGISAWTADTILALPHWIHNLTEEEAPLFACLARSGRLESNEAAVTDQLDSFYSLLILVDHLIEEGPGLFLVRGVPIQGASDARLLEMCLRILRHLQAESAPVLRAREDGSIVQGARVWPSAERGIVGADLPAGAAVGVIARPGGSKVLKAVSVATIQNRLLRKSPDLVSALCRPPISASSGDSLGQPVFTAVDGRLACNYAFDALTALVEAPGKIAPPQRDAFDFLGALLEESALQLALPLEAGDLIAVNPMRCLYRFAEAAG